MYDVRYSYLLEQFSDPAPILAEIGRLVATGDFTLGKPVAEFGTRSVTKNVNSVVFVLSVVGNEA